MPEPTVAQPIGGIKGLSAWAERGTNLADVVEVSAALMKVRASEIILIDDWKNTAVGGDHRFVLSPMNCDESYACAWHEMGHEASSRARQAESYVAFQSGVDLRFGREGRVPIPSPFVLLMEAEAWMWAIMSAKRWTPAMDAAMAYASRTYGTAVGLTGTEEAIDYVWEVMDQTCMVEQQRRMLAATIGIPLQGMGVELRERLQKSGQQISPFVHFSA